MGVTIFRPGQRLVIPGVQSSVPVVEIIHGTVTGVAATGIVSGVMHSASVHGVAESGDVWGVDEHGQVWGVGADGTVYGASVLMAPCLGCVTLAA